MSKYFFVVLIVSALGAMEKPTESSDEIPWAWGKNVCTMPKNDGSENDDVYIRYAREDGSFYGKKEKFEKYCTTLEAIEKASNYFQDVVIKKPLFMQLFVQAANANGKRAIVFNELLHKVGKEIKVDWIFSGNIYMTQKDAISLLACIPRGQLFCLVNGRKVQGFSPVPCETLEDSRENDALKEKNPNLSYRSCSFKKSGIELIQDDKYNFESDKTHHATIVQEFNALLKDLR